METMKYLIIDQELYLIKEQDLRKVYEAEGHCCGSCDKWTLQNLRETLLDIMSRYNPLKVDLANLPDDQFAEESEINLDDGLPF
jgi:hypothetical protein